MKKYILTIALVLPAVLFGQLDRSQRPEPSKAPKINIKDSEVFKTENGITVILSENHKIPKVTFSLSMSGSPEIEGEQSGLSELAGSLIMSGTTNRSKDEIDSEIDYIGARIRAGNSSLSLSCLSKHMDKGLTIMSDILMNANFPQSEVDRIIKKSKSDLLSVKSDPGAMAANARSKVNFPGHPFGEVMTEESLANIDRESIVNYYKKLFVPEGSYLVVVGDIDRAKTSEVVDKYFESWSGKLKENTNWGSVNPMNGNRVIFVKKPGAVQSNISITFPMDIKPGNPDYLKLKVLNGVLGGGAFGNRLMQNLREDKAYTYGCRSSLFVSEHGSSFRAGGDFRNEVSDSAITQILYELERIVSAEVEDDEINLTKSSMAGSFARSLERPSTIAGFALNIIRNNLPKDYYQTYLQNLDAVTKEDVLAVAKKYFTATNCNIVVVGNEEILDKLKKFDSDGHIEKLDAFGSAVKEILPADIAKEELIERYLGAVTMTDNAKSRNKKMKKVKSFEEVIELTMDQMPFPMKSTRVWMSPNIEGQKMEGQGMVFQKSFFDGTTGASVNMQTGKTELSAEEIAAKNKSVGLFPEMNFATSGMEYEILGIENRNGTPCYVLKSNDGSSESYDYFDKETYFKIASVSIQSDGEETRETSMSFANFEETDGFMFPMEINVSMGPMNLAGKVVSRTINAKVDIESFK